MHCVRNSFWQLVVIVVSFLNSLVSFRVILLVISLFWQLLEMFCCKEKESKSFYWSKTVIDRLVSKHPTREINRDVPNVQRAVCGLISPKVKVSLVEVAHVLHYHSFPSYAPSDSATQHVVQIRHFQDIEKSPRHIISITTILQWIKMFCLFNLIGCFFIFFQVYSPRSGRT